MCVMATACKRRCVPFGVGRTRHQFYCCESYVPLSRAQQNTMVVPARPGTTSSAQLDFSSLHTLLEKMHFKFQPDRNRLFDVFPLNTPFRTNRGPRSKRRALRFTGPERTVFARWRGLSSTTSDFRVTNRTVFLEAFLKLCKKYCSCPVVNQDIRESYFGLLFKLPDYLLHVSRHQLDLVDRQESDVFRRSLFLSVFKPS